MTAQYRKLALAMLLVTTVTLPALAQTVGTEGTGTSAAADARRDQDQQNAISNGLQSGNISNTEASQLERQQSSIEKIEARDEKNGTLTPAERTRIEKRQQHAARTISGDETNGVTGNPNAAGTKALERDTTRDAKQQGRIVQGLHSGSLTRQEAGKAETYQSHDARIEARTAADGKVNGADRKAINNSLKRDSREIRDEKHNQTAQ